MMPTKDLHTHVLVCWGMVLHHLDREDVCAARGLEKLWCSCFWSHVHVWLIFLFIYFYMFWVLFVFLYWEWVFLYFIFYLQPILFQRLKHMKKCSGSLDKNRFSIIVYLGPFRLQSIFLFFPHCGFMSNKLNSFCDNKSLDHTHFTPKISAKTNLHVLSLC